MYQHGKDFRKEIPEMKAKAWGLVAAYFLLTPLLIALYVKKL